jgi:hypothetical protein
MFGGGKGGMLRGMPPGPGGIFGGGKGGMFGGILGPARQRLVFCSYKSADLT